MADEVPCASAEIAPWCCQSVENEPGPAICVADGSDHGQESRWQGNSRKTRSHADLSFVEDRRSGQPSQREPPVLLSRRREERLRNREAAANEHRGHGLERASLRAQCVEGRN